MRSDARLLFVSVHPGPARPPPFGQIFMSAFSSRWGSFEGAASFQLIVFLASNLCGIFCVTSNRWVGRLGTARAPAQGAHAQWSDNCAA